MDARKKAAETILDRGVRFKMPAPFLIRILRLNRIRVKPFRPGTILEFSRIILDNDLESAESATVEQLHLKIKPIARCIAVSILNSRVRIKWFTGIYSKWLLWRTHYLNLIEMFVTLKELNAAHDFTSITRFFCHQTRMMMNPKNLGHEKTGS
ncbi:MAG: hypothetical protein PWQ06_2053 [Anaerophaga sp.]|nr:hypothetical protein [Anaerophaga sp.]